MYVNGYMMNTMPTGNQPYGYPINPYFNMPNQQQQQQTMQSNTNKIFVNGIDDVKNRYVPNGTSMMFLDNDKPLLYDKSVDNNGKMSLEVYDISKHTEVENKINPNDFVTKKEFEEWKSQHNQKPLEREEVINV